MGILGLCGLALAAIPLAAPGPALIPAAAGGMSGRPGWLLGLYGDGLGLGHGGYYAFIWLAFGSYLCLLAGAPALSRRTIRMAIAIGVLAFTLAPPLLSQDVFNYISYARLGAAHGLNPYLHAPAANPADAAFRFVGWPGTVSAYGPLFTLTSLPLGLVSVPAALWSLKALAGASVLALAALCARLAPQRGVDPRVAAALVALNPLVLVHVVGGAHNDGLMMLAVLAACAGVLALREGAAGASLVLAAAIKVSALFAVPFALIGCGRRGRLILAALATLGLLAAITLIAFGPHGLDAVGIAGENQARTSNYSLPRTISDLAVIGIGPVRTIALGLYAVLFTWLLVWTWRGGDWLRAAGWAALGLLAASAWLVPWYLIWVLPLAGLSRDRLLIGATLTLTAYQLVNRIPL